MADRAWTWVLVATLLGACGAGDDDDDAAGDDILIGVLAPTSGDDGGFGPRIIAATEVAIDEINRSGGVLGKALAYRHEDTATDADVALARLGDLADAGVKLVIGPGSSSEVVNIYESARAHDMVLVSYSATSPSITALDDGGAVWRTAPSDAFQGKALAALATDDLGLTHVEVVFRDDAYGNGLANTFAAGFAGTSGLHAYDPEDPDYADVAQDIDPTADAVLLISFGEGSEIVNTADTLGFAGDWLFCDGNREQSFLDAITDQTYVEGALGSVPAGGRGTLYDGFSAAYSAAAGEVPGGYTENAYDAVYLGALAMALGGGEDGASVRAGLAQVSAGAAVEAGDWSGIAEALEDGATELDYRGASGEVNLDAATGDVRGPVNIGLWIVHDGAIEHHGDRTVE